MRFYLVYRGNLPASANKSKAADVKAIRDSFNPQLKNLWDTNAALKRLRWTARVPENPAGLLSCPESPFEPYGEPPQELPAGYKDLCEPLTRDGKTYHPLVRETLSLNCSLDIMFLRQEDPGSLVLQGGDLDGRVKTLFDALRVPDVGVTEKHPQAQDPTYCLMENDTLISGFQVTTGRLLMPETTHAHKVHLVIGVTVRVLRIGAWNACLTGD
jgi:hypothetical protein